MTNPIETLSSTSQAVEPKQHVIFIASFKEPFTPKEQLAEKFKGSGDPVGSHLPSNGEADKPYSERRLEELQKVYAGILLDTLTRV